MNDSSEDYLEGLTKEDLALSKAGLTLLQGKKVARFRFNSERNELFIEFDDGTRLFIDNIQDKQDISVSAGQE